MSLFDSDETCAVCHGYLNFQVPACSCATVDNEISTSPQPKCIYYCEQCFHTRGEIVEMGASSSSRYVCPACEGEWKLNRGQVRHVVSLKLQHYRQLAKELGILEIEEEAAPVPIRVKPIPPTTRIIKEGAVPPRGGK